MMKLEDIGFYTLSDKRAKSSSINSPLWRCELILTDACNFRCPYCRGLRDDIKGTLPFESATKVVDLWCKEGLKNIRFSGGEPTIYKGLDKLVSQAKDQGCDRIAVSTNGSASKDLYDHLISCGVSDFSISLDGGCCSIGDDMSGGISGSWNHVVETIKHVSKKVYCSVGMVFTEQNVNQCVDAVLFADSLGVSDIRVIPSAQFNEALSLLSKLPEDILNKYPILRYRINNIKQGLHVRGIDKENKNKCMLAIDDMAVAGDYHFPCIIYMREGGDPVGKVSPNMRKEREDWIHKHDPSNDPICSKNCLDVCVAFNECAAKRD